MYSSNVHYKPIQNTVQLVHYLKMCFDNLKKVDFHIYLMDSCKMFYFGHTCKIIFSDQIIDCIINTGWCNCEATYWLVDYGCCHLCFYSLK